LVHVVEEWKKIKEVLAEAAVQTVGNQTKTDKRRWFDEEYSIEEVN
jgi:hypothetical protein